MTWESRWQPHAVEERFAAFVRAGHLQAPRIQAQSSLSLYTVLEWSYLPYWLYLRLFHRSLIKNVLHSIHTH
jgi:hypothetical protein